MEANQNVRARERPLLTALRLAKAPTSVIRRQQATPHRARAVVVIAAVSSHRGELAVSPGVRRHPERSFEKKMPKSPS